MKRSFLQRRFWTFQSACDSEKGMAFNSADLAEEELLELNRQIVEKLCEGNGVLQSNTPRSWFALCDLFFALINDTSDGRDARADSQLCVSGQLLASSSLRQAGHLFFWARAARARRISQAA